MYFVLFACLSCVRFVYILELFCLSVGTFRLRVCIRVRERVRERVGTMFFGCDVITSCACGRSQLMHLPLAFAYVHVEECLHVSKFLR